MHVLVVEDDPATAARMVRGLKSAGLSVSLSTDRADDVGEAAARRRRIREWIPLGALFAIALGGALGVVLLVPPVQSLERRRVALARRLGERGEVDDVTANLRMASEMRDGWNPGARGSFGTLLLVHRATGSGDERRRPRNARTMRS